MKRQMYLGCIITRGGIYIDTWHDITSFQEFDNCYLIERMIENHIVVFMFGKVS